MNQVKFMYNGIKIDGKLYPANYSKCDLFKRPAGTIVIYLKNYNHLPQVEGLNTQNNTDSKTDYYEKDRLYIEPSSPFYAEVLQAIKARDEHTAKTQALKTPEELTQKIKALASLIQEHQLETYAKNGYTLDPLHACGTKIINGQKFTKIDVGQSGKYMIENSTGNIYGIKGYGVVHRGKFYGTLDTINDYWWGEYTAFMKRKAS